MNLDDLLSQLPIDQLAAQLGVSPEEATQAVRAAAPALVQGMEANAQDPGGAASLEEALFQHAGGGLDLGALDFGAVDTQDGEKIVNHVFGDNTQQVTQQLGGVNALGGGLISKLLPLLAPLVMSWLAGKFKGGGQGQAQAPADPGSGGLSGWLSSILGGGDAPAPQSSGPTSAPGPGGPAAAQAQAPTPAQAPASDGLGGVLGDLLGGLLGQGRKG